MRLSILLLVVALTSLASYAQETMPLAKLAGKATISYDPPDLEWLRYGGTMSISILVDKNGRAKVIDVTGPMAPCSDLASRRLISLRKTAIDTLEKAVYETAKDKDGNPVDGGLKLSIKIPERQPGPVAEIPGPGGTNLPKQVVGGVLNGKALSLPKPVYPSEARDARASGTVNVQVLIDETGKIISAAAVTGHPYLRAASTEAACGAKFSPTLLQGVPVKVSGVITYNFVP